MSLPVPSEMTASVGAILTAAQWNSNVRDAVNFLAQPPLFVGYQATAQAIPATAWTAINLDSSVADTYSGHSNTVNNSRYTAQVAGWYFMFGMAALASGTGIRYAAFFTNGGQVAQQPADSQSAPSGAPNLQLAAGLQYLTVGSYVDLRAYTTAAVNTNVTTTQQSMMGLWWVHS